MREHRNRIIEVGTIVTTQISRLSILKKMIETRMPVFNTIGRKTSILSFMQVSKKVLQLPSTLNQILKSTSKALDMRILMRSSRLVKLSIWRSSEEKEPDQSGDVSTKNIRTALNQERLDQDLIFIRILSNNMTKSQIRLHNSKVPSMRAFTSSNKNYTHLEMSNKIHKIRHINHHHSWGMKLLQTFSTAQAQDQKQSRKFIKMKKSVMLPHFQGYLAERIHHIRNTEKEMRLRRQELSKRSHRMMICREQRATSNTFMATLGILTEKFKNKKFTFFVKNGRI